MLLEDHMKGSLDVGFRFSGPFWNLVVILEQEHVRRCCGPGEQYIQRCLQPDALGNKYAILLVHGPN
jgi:hypothetical protein